METNGSGYVRQRYAVATAQDGRRIPVSGGHANTSSKTESSADPRNSYAGSLADMYVSGLRKSQPEDYLMQLLKALPYGGRDNYFFFDQVENYLLDESKRANGDHALHASIGGRFNNLGYKAIETGTNGGVPINQHINSSDEYRKANEPDMAVGQLIRAGEIIGGNKKPGTKEFPMINLVWNLVEEGYSPYLHPEVVDTLMDHTLAEIKNHNLKWHQRENFEEFTEEFAQFCRETGENHIENGDLTQAAEIFRSRISVLTSAFHFDRDTADLMNNLFFSDVESLVDLPEELEDGLISLKKDYYEDLAFIISSKVTTKEKLSVVKQRMPYYFAGVSSWYDYYTASGESLLSEVSKGKIKTLVDAANVFAYLDPEMRRTAEFINASLGNSDELDGSEEFMQVALDYYEELKSLLFVPGEEGITDETKDRIQDISLGFMEYRIKLLTYYGDFMKADKEAAKYQELLDGNLAEDGNRLTKDFDADRRKKKVVKLKKDIEEITDTSKPRTQDEVVFLAREILSTSGQVCDPEGLQTIKVEQIVLDSLIRHSRIIAENGISVDSNEQVEPTPSIMQKINSAISRLRGKADSEEGVGSSPLDDDNLCYLYETLYNLGMNMEERIENFSAKLDQHQDVSQDVVASLSRARDSLGTALQEVWKYYYARNEKLSHERELRMDQILQLLFRNHYQQFVEFTSELYFPDQEREFYSVYNSIRQAYESGFITMPALQLLRQKHLGITFSSTPYKPFQIEMHQDANNMLQELRKSINTGHNFGGVSIGADEIDRERSYAMISS